MAPRADARTAAARTPQATETTSAAETEALGTELARRLAPGDVVLVSGDLGAGKTTFVRGALRALGVDGPVTSPTFTIARRYHGATVEVSHLDLHRLSGGLDEEDEAVLADEVAPDRVAFVEWPELADELLGRAGRVPGVAARVHLDHAGGDRRRITIDET
jgi:tRNA threonylcarbamoyladenosine biosynthesis protein TsaE